jgi:F0F1-type ATP synthase assembly protein I
MMMIIALPVPPLIIGEVALTIATFVAVLCPILYLIVSKGSWRGSEVGRHLVAFMIGEAFVLLLSWIAMLTVITYGWPDPPWFKWVRLVAFIVGVLGVLVWRLVLLLRALVGRPLT